MTGFELGPYTTALPTEPQPLPQLNKMFSLATPTSITFDQMNLISVWSCCFCHD